MQIGRIIDWTDWANWAATGLVLAWILPAPPASAQAARVAGSAPAPEFRFLVSVPGGIRNSADRAGQLAGELVREIDDPNNGDRWLLTRDESHPGGPGLLMLVSTARINPAINPAVLRNPTQKSPQVETPAPIIRAGDLVILEENTPVVQARLEAVAMGPALAGAPFSVRLSIGGRVVRAVAIMPGRAVFEEETQR
jgi:hypothetical protein